MVSNGGGFANGTDTIDVSVLCSPNSYAIGVTVAGLTGTGLVVQNNGGDPLSISANGLSQFSISVDSGSPYEVTVLSQPTGQQCSVVSGAGTVGAAAINVAVNCVALPDSWNWVGGSNLAGSPGVYGTLDVGAPGIFRAPVTVPFPGKIRPATSGYSAGSDTTQPEPPAR